MKREIENFVRKSGHSRKVDGESGSALIAGVEPVIGSEIFQLAL